MNAFFQFIKGENYTVVRFYLHPISSIKSIKKTPPCFYWISPQQRVIVTSLPRLILGLAYLKPLKSGGVSFENDLTVFFT